MSQSLLILTGHSQGLGRAILDFYLQKENFRIIAISRSKLNLNISRLKELSLDLSNLELLEKELDGIFPDEAFEEIILINNAGWIGEIKSVGKLQLQNLNTQIKLNLLAPMYLTNAFVDAYRHQKSKRSVCNISSGAAYKPVAGWSGYCSSKAGLSMFTLTCQQENLESGIRFFSLAPGIVDTAMQDQIRRADEKDFPNLERFKGYKAKGELTRAEEVAKKISYLMSNPDKFTDVIQDVRNFELP